MPADRLWTLLCLKWFPQNFDDLSSWVCCCTHFAMQLFLSPSDYQSRQVLLLRGLCNHIVGWKSDPETGAPENNVSSAGVDAAVHVQVLRVHWRERECGAGPAAANGCGGGRLPGRRPGQQVSRIWFPSTLTLTTGCGQKQGEENI